MSCTTGNMNFPIENSDNEILKKTTINIHNRLDLRYRHDCLNETTREYNSNIDNKLLNLDVMIDSKGFDFTGDIVYKHPITGISALAIMLIHHLTAIPPIYADKQIAIDAKLKLNDFVLGEYHTDGIKDSNWVFGMYGKYTLDNIDEKNIKASFSQGMNEIFKQIENDEENIKIKISNITKEQKELLLAKEKEEKALQLAKLNFKKKYGKPKCPNNLSNQVISTLLGQSDLSQNCIHYLDKGWLFIFQQDLNGTLTYSKDIFGPEPFFIYIVKNNTDSKQVDGAIVKGGLFEVIGRHTYTTILGASKTVYKLKRLSTE